MHENSPFQHSSPKRGSQIRLFSKHSNGLQNSVKLIIMKKANIKSRIRKEELNPVFHFKDKEEDDKVLTKAIIQEALKSGKLKLTGKNLKYGTK